MGQLKRLLKSKVFQATALGLLSALLLIGANQWRWMDGLERRTLDWRFREFTSTPPPTDVVIIALDDTSFNSQGMLDNFGRWPWRRQLYALLVHSLHEWGAKVIGLDLLYQGADPHQGDDALFAQALEEQPNVVLAFDVNRGGFRETDPVARQRQKAELDRFALPVADTGRLNLRAYSDVDLPLNSLTKSIPAIGCYTMQPDDDGVVRSSTPIFRFGQHVFPSLALAVAAVASGKGGLHSLGISPRRELEFAGHKFPLDEEGRLAILWHGPAYGYHHYHVLDVFNSALAYENGQKPKISPFEFKGKIVLIGATAVGASDLRTTSMGENFPGVEVHATIVDNLLRGELVSQVPGWVTPIAVLAMGLLMAGLVYSFNSALFYTLLAILAGLSYFSVVCALFHHSHLCLPVVSPLSSAALAFTSSTVIRYATEGREKHRYRKTLLKYVSPSLVDTIMQDYNWGSLHAEKRVLTVLFSDVRGFTTFSEKFPPETVIATLNEHLNMMVDVVFRHQGTLDKFVGDCVMAFWGAPIHQDSQAELAARAALDMLAGLEKLNQKWQSEGRPTLHIGVGINTGEMLFGNIGSEQRMDFTVIGDAVNLGARLESSTKELKAWIVISDSTYERIKDFAQVRDLGEISVKGKDQKVQVYELLGMAAQGEQARALAAGKTANESTA
jgi:adenylate cyclase